jgi:hypothetical protein
LGDAVKLTEEGRMKHIETSIQDVSSIAIGKVETRKGHPPTGEFFTRLVVFHMTDGTSYTVTAFSSTRDSLIVEGGE